MPTTAHRLTAKYDSIDRCIAVNIPARTLANTLVPNPDPTTFDVLVDAVNDADTTRSGIGGLSESDQIVMHNEAVELLADNLTGGRDLTLDARSALDLVSDLLAVLADRSLVSDKPNLLAAFGLITRVKNDEARNAMIARRSVPRQAHPVVAHPARVA